MQVKCSKVLLLSSAEQLSIDNPNLALKCGDTPEKRIDQFGRLVEDTCVLGQIIAEKLQRALNEMRKVPLQNVKHKVEGKIVVCTDFAPRKKRSTPLQDSNDITTPAPLE